MRGLSDKADAKEFRTMTEVVQAFQVTRQLKILVAEDSPIIQAILLRMLNALGHEIVIVNDGREAVGAIQANDFDLVLMDMRMPEMDGEAATRSIRNNPSDIAFTPIIACSADTSDEKVSRFIKAGVNACIGKPVDREKLLLTINEILDETVHIPVDGVAGPSQKKELSDNVDNQTDEDDQDVAAFLESLKTVD